MTAALKKIFTEQYKKADMEGKKNLGEGTHDDLKKAWEGFNPVMSQKVNIEDQVILQIMEQKSKSPLSILRKNVLFKIYFIIGFIIIFSGLFLIFDLLPVRILLGIMIACYMAALPLIYKSYRKLSTEVVMDHNILDVLKEYYQTISSVLKVEERFSLFIYPISASAGFFLGVSISTSIEEAFSKSSTALALVISIAILNTIFHYLTKWMNKKGFGKYMDELLEKINLIEAGK